MESWLKKQIVSQALLCGVVILSRCAEHCWLHTIARCIHFIVPSRVGRPRVRTSASHASIMGAGAFRQPYRKTSVHYHKWPPVMTDINKGTTANSSNLMAERRVGGSL